MPVSVLFVLDQSSRVGGGHLSRCLNVARELSKRNVVVWLTGSIENPDRVPSFISVLSTNTTYKNSCEDATSLAEVMLSNNIDTVVLDNYSYDEVFHLALRRHDIFVVMFEDEFITKNRANIEIQMACDERSVKQSTSDKVLNGLIYSAIRRENNFHIDSTNPGEDIVILFGSVIPFFVAEILQYLINHTDRNIRVYGDDIDSIAKEFIAENVQFMGFIENLNRAYTNCYLAIGSASTAALERLSIGVPCFSFALVKNQQKMASAIHKELQMPVWDLCENLTGWQESLSVTMKYGIDIKHIQLAKKIVDGHGASRIAEYLVNEKIYEVNV